MTHDLVIKNGLIITASDCVEANLAVDGERITAIGTGLAGRQEIDAAGMYVIPGAVDPHCHFRNPSFPPQFPPTADDFRTGSIAAAFGGVTTVLDFAEPLPGEGLMQELERRRSDAEGCSLIDWGLHLNLRDPNPACLAEVPKVIASGVPSFKLYMAYETYELPDDALLRTMETLATHNGMAVMHAENSGIVREMQRRFAYENKSGPRWHVPSRPPAGEGEAVHRALVLAGMACARVLIFHISAAEAVQEVRLARQRGQSVYAETCTHYLAYTDDIFNEDNVVVRSLMVMPPIRDASHQRALWAGLADGSLDYVSTDHCPRPHLPDQRPAHPAGASEVEVRLALLHTLGVLGGHISLNRWVDACCSRPAQLFGLQRKGSLLPGYDADIVIFDPSREVTFSPKVLHTPITYSSFEGITVKGYPVSTISRGEIIVSEGRLRAAPGRGRWVARSYS